MKVEIVISPPRMSSSIAPANEESLSRPTETVGRRRPRPRIETLADLVFGLSLSLGALALLVNPPASLDEINGHILAFILTFLITITAWLIYTTYMSVLPVETRAVTFLNVILLFLIAVVPYLLNTVEVANPSLKPAEASSLRDYASSLFTVDLAGILAILATFAHVLSIEEKGLVPSETVRLFRNGRNRMAALALLMAISIAPQFWQVTILGVPARFYMWYVPLISYWVGRAVRPETRTYRMS